MKAQSKTWSIIETVTSVASGFVIAVLTQLIMFPFFGVHVTLSENIQMTFIFTIISLFRGYYVRRFFNWVHNRDK